MSIYKIPHSRDALGVFAFYGQKKGRHTGDLYYFNRILQE